MRLALTALRRIEIQPAPALTPVAGTTRLVVAYCGVCRTDAKMWREGHRDLVLPRVPGHEIVARDENGRLVAVWPGSSCGRCSFCRAGRENLCETMAILGFHNDGGFSSHVVVPTQSILAVPEALAPHLACFAEPVGCIFNALEKADLQAGQQVAILGGGTMGLLCARVAQTLGAQALVLEKRAAKIAQAAPFLAAGDIDCRQACTRADFDVVINVCADPAALERAVTLLAKGGRLIFFSGLAGGQTIETDRINRLHYREATLQGAYGLTRKQMQRAMAWLARHAACLEHLVAGIIGLRELEAVLPTVLAGDAFKYILDCRPQGR